MGDSEVIFSVPMPDANSSQSIHAGAAPFGVVGTYRDQPRNIASAG
jgi:hypothetical protein